MHDGVGPSRKKSPPNLLFKMQMKQFTQDEQVPTQQRQEE